MSAKKDFAYFETIIAYFESHPPFFLHILKVPIADFKSLIADVEYPIVSRWNGQK